MSKKAKAQNRTKLAIDRRREFSDFLRIARNVDRETEITYVQAYSAAKHTVVFTPSPKPAVLIGDDTCTQAPTVYFNGLIDDSLLQLLLHYKKGLPLYLLNKRSREDIINVDSNVLTDITSRIVNGESFEWEVADNRKVVISGGSTFLYCFFTRDNLLAVIPWECADTVGSLANMIMNAIYINGFEWRI